MIFKDLKIKTKLIILSVIPIVVILLLTSMTITYDYNKKTEYSHLQEVIHLNSKISLLIHELQKERGATATFMESKSEKFKTMLLQQRENTNAKLKDLKDFLTNYDTENLQNTVDTLNLAINKLSQITNLREEILKDTLPSSKAISYYTNTNSIFLDFISQSSKLSKNAEITYSILAYYNFLMSKERAGIERAVGSVTFENDQFAQGAKSKLQSLVSQQNSYMKSFLSLASEEAKQFKEKILVGKNVDEVNRMREILFSANEIGGFGVESTYWFDTKTQKINQLKKVEDYIASKLYSNNIRIDNSMKISKAIGNLLHETQKERGATAGFIGSNGKKFTNKLPLQRTQTNQKIKELKNLLLSIDISEYTPKIQKNLRNSLNHINNLNNIRTKVSNLDISANEAISYYTKMNANFLTTISSSVVIITNPKELVNLTAYYYFLMSKERSGVERAVLANTFARNKFLPHMKEKFTKLMTEQSTFIQSFLAVASKDIEAYYFKMIEQSSIKEVQNMRDIAKNTVTIGGFGIESTYWFDSISEKINLLKKIDDFLAAELLNKVNNNYSSITQEFYAYIFITAFIISLLFIITYITFQNIHTSTQIIYKGIEQFMRYLSRESNIVHTLDLHTKDEFGEIAKMTNLNIEKIDKELKDDKLCVDDAIFVLSKMQKGELNSRVTKKSDNPQIQTLIDAINKGLDIQANLFSDIQKVLNDYSNYNYTSKIDHNEIEGELRELTDGINFLSKAITGMLVENQKNGNTLGESSNILLDNVDKLNKNSNEAAAALEETAAAVEEITSNISSNVTNVVEMSKYAEQLNISSQHGQKLAQQTTQAMDKINSEVTSINEAIGVIDQIAFQTNILSLNAAVEAATAGEAGKGFAVVAQEVRNLASRSAEAAKEIKDLVQNAKNKANEGKVISDTMIEGYSELNGNVSKTLELIKGIESSTKEQQSGMIQINDAINSLDRQTQENANIANNTQQTAVDTNSISDIIIQNVNTKEFIGKNH